MILIAVSTAGKAEPVTSSAKENQLTRAGENTAPRPTLCSPQGSVSGATGCGTGRLGGSLRGAILADAVHLLGKSATALGSW